MAQLQLRAALGLQLAKSARVPTADLQLLGEMLRRHLVPRLRLAALQALSQTCRTLRGLLLVPHELADALHSRLPAGYSLLQPLPPAQLLARLRCSAQAQARLLEGTPSRSTNHRLREGLHKHAAAAVRPTCIPEAPCWPAVGPPQCEAAQVLSADASLLVLLHGGCFWLYALTEVGQRLATAAWSCQRVASSCIPAQQAGQAHCTQAGPPELRWSVPCPEQTDTDLVWDCEVHLAFASGTSPHHCAIRHPGQQ